MSLRIKSKKPNIRFAGPDEDPRKAAPEIPKGRQKS
jgi:hypothetical protein